MGSADLDARILQVEQRLVAREQTLRRGLEGVGRRVQRALQPWRRALPAMSATLAVSALAALVWRWQRRRSPLARFSTAAPQPSPAAAQGGEFPWVRLVALVWPLLPAAWRTRVSPGTASMVAALGPPMLEWSLHRQELPPLPTMAAVDPTRFAGPWFVVAQLPRQRGEPAPRMLNYLLRPDGAFDVATSTVGAVPGEASALGLARVVPGSGGAKLALSAWPAWLRALPLAWSEHWIVHVGADYTEALVGSPARDRLFVLSRRPTLTPQRRHDLLQLARDRGFAVERLEPAAAG
jgi:apolipoprotein D and lipocalin family protein